MDTDDLLIDETQPGVLSDGIRIVDWLRAASHNIYYGGFVMEALAQSAEYVEALEARVAKLERENKELGDALSGMTFRYLDEYNR